MPIILIESKKEASFLKFNRKTDAERRIEQFAKKKASKMAGKAGMAAAKASWKVIVTIAGFIGAPLFFLILIIVIFLMILPSSIFSSSLGMDSLHNDGSLNAPVDNSWEINAETELSNRYNQLTATGFWEGLVNFFSSGSWNDPSVETFKTEYANADDLDESGKSISTGYFSASNRLIAIINQAFITSKKDATTSSGGFFSSTGLNRAKKLAQSMANDRSAESVYAQMRATYPSVPEENITIQTTEQDNPNEDFIQQACYLVAACSQKVNQNNTYDEATKFILDKAFVITGIDVPIDDSTTEICWTPSVTWTHSYREVPETRWVTVWNPYHTLLVPAGSWADLDGNGYPEYYPDDVWQGGWEQQEESYIAYYLDINFNYGVSLATNYEDIVDRNLGISSTISASDSRFDLSEKDIVQTNSRELLKFYNGFVGDLGVVGLPLPERSYRIGDPFMCMCEVHAPRGHSGQDLPAGNGTGVFSVADGIIIFTQTGQVNNPGAGGMAAYGNCVFIEHRDESGGVYYTRYAHLESVLVGTGETVTAGQPIGTVGNTGNSFGNHLHFEMLVGGNDASNRVDPLASSLGELLRANAIS